MGLRNAQAIGQNTAAKSVSAVADATTIVVGAPVHLYLDSSGVLTCTLAAVDSSSKNGRWGIARTASSSAGTVVNVIVAGNAPVITDGTLTAGYQVTAITAAGSITSAATASANADLSLGVVLDTSTLILYP